ncbi:MAG TPA: NUDIX domain-containing protein [Candidatus Polarisedimenticolia bacterium]|nr:NUDIX domain-containing protein [Candidatus Polarisedimenticolia bacterium]
MTRVVGLVMAGGRGRRMRRSTGDETPKPLVRVGGVPLLERNLFMLLRAGVGRIVIAVPADAPALCRFAETRCVQMGRALGARVEVFVETRPLGTIGAAALVETAAEDSLLVVNADNLTDLDLARLAARHRDSPAAMTVATHLHPFRIPFAEVTLQEGRVSAYREKPAFPVRVSSAVHVLGGAARAALRPGETADVPDLVARLLAAGERVEGFEHEAAWIDVNDAEALEAAELLLAARRDSFECWTTTRDEEVVGCLLQHDQQLLLEWRPETARCYASRWDTPGGRLEPGESPEQALRREMQEELGLSLALSDLRAVTRFDDVDAHSGRVFRHHVFQARLETGDVRSREGRILKWHPRAALPSLQPLSAAVVRAVASWRGEPS